MRGGAEHAKAAGAADGGDDVAAMAEGEQRKLDSQPVADRRFHGCALPAAAFGLLSFLIVVLTRPNASPSRAGKPSRVAAPRCCTCMPPIPQAGTAVLRLALSRCAENAGEQPRAQQ